MYESFYGLKAKPFQLNPDPSFFYGSKVHKRAMSYLEYGVSQGEGFLVITGEVGAGKTTLMRHLFQRLEPHKFQTAHIVNTSLDPDSALRMVVAAFGISCEGLGKAALLMRLEQFLRDCDRHGKRALLVVDEAQNLSPATLEELRMLSNYQTAEKSLLQTFLLGQPEFRRTLHCAELQQLRQRVIASYHLGPMDAEETHAYIEHRLGTAGWRGDPAISREATRAIHDYTGGIPRKINTLCDRMFLMGFLEDIHAFDESHVRAVIDDMREEFDLSSEAAHAALPIPVREDPSKIDGLERLDQRLSQTERSVVYMLDALRRMLSSSRA